MSVRETVGAVIIGRNEGDRLLRCLASLPTSIGRTVYVDSGSTDGSAEAARANGAEVVSLDLSTPFTAARARNAGFAKLVESQQFDFVQFIDGDCELRDEWLETAMAFLSATSKAAVVCGRRRERFPEASVYNQLCDREWNTPIGQAKACGGDALIRGAAFEGIGGFNPSLIAGEEPELCVRLRAKDWQIWRLDCEMTWHDAAITRFGQWWNRTKRSGYAFAEGAAMHGAEPERHWVRETMRALIWGVALPIFILICLSIFGPWGLLSALLYPLQVVRIARRDRDAAHVWACAMLTVGGKFPEALGVLQYWTSRLRRKRSELIEYK